MSTLSQTAGQRTLMMPNLHDEADTMLASAEESYACVSVSDTAHERMCDISVITEPETTPTRSRRSSTRVRPLSSSKKNRNPTKHCSAPSTLIISNNNNGYTHISRYNRETSLESSPVSKQREQWHKNRQNCGLQEPRRASSLVHSVGRYNQEIVINSSPASKQGERWYKNRQNHGLQRPRRMSSLVPSGSTPIATITEAAENHRERRIYNYRTNGTGQASRSLLYDLDEDSDIEGSSRMGRTTSASSSDSPHDRFILDKTKIRGTFSTRVRDTLPRRPTRSSSYLSLASSTPMMISTTIDANSGEKPTLKQVIQSCSASGKNNIIDTGKTRCSSSKSKASSSKGGSKKSKPKSKSERSMISKSPTSVLDQHPIDQWKEYVKNSPQLQSERKRLSNKTATPSASTPSTSAETLASSTRCSTPSPTSERSMLKKKKSFQRSMSESNLTQTPRRKLKKKKESEKQHQQSEIKSKPRAMMIVSPPLKREDSIVKISSRLLRGAFRRQQSEPVLIGTKTKNKTPSSASRSFKKRFNTQGSGENDASSQKSFKKKFTPPGTEEEKKKEIGRGGSRNALLCRQLSEPVLNAKIQKTKASTLIRSSSVRAGQSSRSAKKTKRKSIDKEKQRRKRETRRKALNRRNSEPVLMIHHESIDWPPSWQSPLALHHLHQEVEVGTIVEQY